MIELYKFVPQFGMRDASPFCLKLLTYLKLADIPHETHEILDPREAPKQKLPFIIDDGISISDSEIIISHLKNKFGDPLNDGLSPEQMANSHALSIMFAERYYWAGLVYPRWLKAEYQPVLVDAWFGSVPKLFRGFVSRMVFKEMAKRAEGHGIGKHNESEVFDLALSDLRAVENLMGNKPFLMDEKPREIDATAYAFLVNTTAEPFRTPMSEYVKKSNILMEYIERVDKAAFA